MLYCLLILNTECTLDWVKPPNIPFDNVKCALTHNCTRVDCCVSFKPLNLNVHMFLHFDRCNYIISGGIEKKTFSYGLLDFTDFWGRVTTKPTSGLNFTALFLLNVWIIHKIALCMLFRKRSLNKYCWHNLHKVSFHHDFCKNTIHKIWLRQTPPKILKLGLHRILQVHFQVLLLVLWPHVNVPPRFKASQLEVSKKYVLDLSVEICLEPDSCALDVPIFDQVLIPILNCDLTMDFNLKGQIFNKSAFTFYRYCCLTHCQATRAFSK